MFSESFLEEATAILRTLSAPALEAVVDLLCETRDRGGRLFFCGSGGGAGHASHATCDFRKLCAIESYSVSDNVSELTARVNDEGWESSYSEWLRRSRLCANDTLFVFSVGGGDVKRSISPNLVSAILLAREVGASITGIVGRDGGFLAQAANVVVVVPTVNPDHVTAHTEGMQAVLWHLLVSHPKLVAAATKWEGALAAETVRPK